MVTMVFHPLAVKYNIKEKYSTESPKKRSHHIIPVRSPTLARDMTDEVFIKVVQSSTLKLAFVVELGLIISKMVSEPILDPLFGDLPYLGHSLMFIPRSRCPALGVKGCVRSLTLARDMVNEVFIKVVQSSTLKLVFVVELGQPFPWPTGGYQFPCHASFSYTLKVLIILM